MSVYQYTTPLITIKMPESISVAAIDSLAVTLKQGKTKLVKSKSEVLLDVASNSIIVNLSQEETGSFDSGLVAVQCHFSVDGDVAATKTAKIDIYENIHGEALEV